MAGCWSRPGGGTHLCCRYEWCDNKRGLCVFRLAGSGSPIAYGVLESTYHKEITNEEAKQIATKAVSAAMERDPGSGNGIDLLAIPNLIMEVAR
ncbi:MAG: hypothetical protein E6K88_05735 [Thaumarchaeota archaeon]|nr:MAG: hypothetical protein E6K88_05735 [Nitrososphaerota archaeon]